MFIRLSTWCFDHRVKALGLWFAALVAVVGAAAAVGPAFGASSEVPDSDSTDGLAVINEHFPELAGSAKSATIVFQADQGVDDPEVQAVMESFFATVNAGFPDENGTPEHPGATVLSPFTEFGQSQIARDGPLADQLAYAQVQFAPDVDDTESSAMGRAMFEQAPGIEGLTVLPGGVYLADVEPPQTELVGVAFAIVVLILAFGSVLAMGLPIAVAVGGVGAGVGMTIILSNVLDVPDFTTMLGMMIGLGVGIDYALFIVTRHREGIHQGLNPREAAINALDSAGRAVIFAGLTVVISMLGLLLVGIGWIAGMGIGVSVTVAATMITSVTLLPALLSFAGDRVEVTRWRGLIAAGFAALALLSLGIGQTTLALISAGSIVATLVVSFITPPLRRLVPRRRVKPVRETFAYRWSRAIQRRPLVAVVASAVILLLLAAPVLDMRLGWSDEGNYPAGTYTREAYDLMAEGFGPGVNGPLIVTAAVDATSSGSAEADVVALQQTLAATPGVALVTPPFPSQADSGSSPNAYLMNVIPTTSPQDEASTELVSTLRETVIPSTLVGSNLDVNVTGAAAMNIDLTDYLAQRTPIFFAAVLALSFVLLMTVFRSLLVPLKAVIMNVLSIASAYGVVVAVFQWGWGGSILGIDGGPINPFIPMMLFAIVFGLSMDYEVFMLSRIREEFDRTGDPVNSVADGLAQTARVITAAAAIMVVVFGSFMFEDNREIKLFGLGLALAVLLDATLVRMLLVPATMELLGERNWWMPKWLDRLLPRLNVEGHKPSIPANPIPANPVPVATSATTDSALVPSPASRPQRVGSGT